MQKLEVNVRRPIVAQAIRGNYNPVMTIGVGGEMNQSIVNILLAIYGVGYPTPPVRIIVHFQTALKIVVGATVERIN